MLPARAAELRSFAQAVRARADVFVRALRVLGSVFVNGVSTRALVWALTLGAGNVGCGASKAPDAAVARPLERPKTGAASAPSEARAPVDQRALKLQARWASPQCGVSSVGIDPLAFPVSMASSAEGRLLSVGGKLLNIETGRVADAPIDATYGIQAVPGTDYFATHASSRSPQPPAVWNEQGEVVYRCPPDGAAAGAGAGQPPLSPAVLDKLCKRASLTPDGPYATLGALASLLPATDARLSRQADVILQTSRDSRGTWLSVWRRGKKGASLDQVAVNKAPLDSWGKSAISDDGNTVAYAVGRSLYLFHQGARPSEEEILLDRQVKGLTFTRSSQEVTVLQTGRVGKVVRGQVEPLFEFAEVPYQKPGRVDEGPLVVQLTQPTRIQLNTDALLSSPVSQQPVERGSVSPDGALVARSSADGVIVEATVSEAKQSRSLKLKVSSDDSSTYGSPSVHEIRWSPDGRRLLAVSRFDEVGRAIVGRLDELDVASGETLWTSMQAPQEVLATREGWVLVDSDVQRIEDGKTVYSGEGGATVAVDADLLVSLHGSTVSLVGAEGLLRKLELAKRRPGHVWQTEVDRQGRWLAIASEEGVAVVALKDGKERLWAPGLVRTAFENPALLGWQGSVLFMRRAKDYLLFEARSQTQLVLGLASHSDAPPQFYAISPNGFVDASPELFRWLSADGKPLPPTCHHPGVLREWLAEVNGI